MVQVLIDMSVTQNILLCVSGFMTRIGELMVLKSKAGDASRRTVPNKRLQPWPNTTYFLRYLLGSNNNTKTASYLARL